MTSERINRNHLETLRRLLAGDEQKLTSDGWELVCTGDCVVQARPVDRTQPTRADEYEMVDTLCMVLRERTRRKGVVLTQPPVTQLRKVNDGQVVIVLSWQEIGSRELIQLTPEMFKKATNWLQYTGSYEEHDRQFETRKRVESQATLF